MGRYLSIQEAKEHLIVESEDYDGYIAELIESAEDQLRLLLNRDSLEEVECFGQLPAALKHALRILVSNLYENREGNRGGRVTNISFTLSSLFMPYRKET